MQRLRFINPMAQVTEVTVAAVNDGEPLVFDEIYTVSNDLAKALLVNENDWRLLSPPPDKTEAPDEDESNDMPVTAETEGDDE